jgi:hypothetical protein
LTTTRDARAVHAPAIVLATFALVWFAIIAGSSAVTSNPVVLSDEATYLLTTLFGYDATNFAGWEIVAQIPNHLYYRIYGSLGASEIYLKAKLLNAAFVAGAALPIWLVARRYLAPWPAAAFSAVAIATPYCTFARYFMPEALYVFGFWWVVCMLLVPKTLNHSAQAVAVGASLGLLSLIKPHALALVVGIALYLALRSGSRSRRTLTIACLVGTFYATRVVVGYAMSGTLDLTVTGPTYRGPIMIDRLELGAIGTNVMGHTAALLLLAGMPLVATLSVLLSSSRPPLDERMRDLLLLSACTLAAVVAMTVWYSYGAHLIDPVGEGVDRLHGRYYAFALPLVFLAYATLLRSQELPSALFSNVALVCVCVVTVAAMVLVTRQYPRSIVDFPELGLLSSWPKGLLVPACALFGCLVLVRVLGQMGFQGGLWRRALPIAWWAGISLTTSLLLLTGPLVGLGFRPGDIDIAMTSSSPFRDLRHRDDGMVIGTNAAAADTYRVMFHLESRSRGRIVAPGTTLSVSSIPSGVNWLILLPGTAYEGAGERNVAWPLTYVGLR